MFLQNACLHSSLSKGYPMTAQPKRLIFDSDMTMGLPDCDIDDGLAILFALGCSLSEKTCTIEGICTSYGNSTLEAVYKNTQQVCATMLPGIPLLKGASDKDNPHSEAARWLVDMAHAHPHELSLAVTGSTTNLKGALALDPTILSAFREVVFMGGITEPLDFNGKIMEELNLSCDATASCLALASANQGATLSVITANNCLSAFFSSTLLSNSLPTQGPFGGFVSQASDAWTDTMRRWYGLNGYHCWDLLVSAYLLAPTLFTDASQEVSIDETLLEQGRLEAPKDAPCVATINAPRLNNVEELRALASRYWTEAINFIDGAAQ